LSTTSPTEQPRRGLFALIGPGLLIAATGVGAGDLATAAFAGSQLGTTILWAAALGAFLKFVINEGLARWQLATGETLIEGAVRHGGRWLAWVFLPYLWLWSFFVGSALMAGCGVALHALLPLVDDPERGKILYGVMSSLLGLALVWGGGFRNFEKAMSACVVLMVASILVMAVVLWPGWEPVLRGLMVPAIPSVEGGGLRWTVAMMGGVGGTLTMLCYGYWIREEGRRSLADLRTCRIDLAFAYGMTALFAMAMVIVGSATPLEGSGARLLLQLADQLGTALGPAGRVLFLLGVLGAVVSSLLGVWQSVPYLFADLWSLARDGVQGQGARGPVDTRAAPYRAYLLLLATVPMIGLLVSFKEMQRLYATVGATIVPLLALALLLMNGRRDWVGKARNRPLTALVLVGALAFFAVLGWSGLAD
jgi:Mn2+/Fe2+ NRAMP family transporter